MPKNIAVITSEEVLSVSLIEISKKLRGTDISEEPDKTRIHLGRNEQNIWSYFSPDEIGYLELVTLEKIKSITQQNPKTCINIEISREGNSDRLAIEFANYLLTQFTGVVYDFKDTVYSSAEIAKMIICELEPIL
jgi:hypothetical protein